LIRSSLIVQQIRYDASDSRSSENQKKSKVIRNFDWEWKQDFDFFVGGKQTDPSKGSDLNKSKTSDKRQKLKTTDDTKQPGE
jgi:hypothetical protein